MTIPYPVGTYVKVREQDIWGFVVEEYGNTVIIEDDASEWEAPDNRLEYRTDEVEAARSKNRQHTPGPWELRQSSRDYWFIDHEQGDESYTLTKLEDWTSEADARLIAAAPDLLACLCEMLGAAEMDCMDDKSNVWRNLMSNAQVAIEKATGEKL